MEKDPHLQEPRLGRKDDGGAQHRVGNAEGVHHQHCLRSDLEAKLREIEGVVIETEDEVRSRGRLIVAGVAVVAVVLIGYTVWRMRRKPIQVEVYYSS